MQVSSEYDGVCFGELCVGAGVQRGQTARVAALHPQRGRVVRRVVGALRDAHPDAWHVLMAGQVRQVRLEQKNSVYFYCPLSRSRFNIDEIWARTKV